MVFFDKIIDVLSGAIALAFVAVIYGLVAAVVLAPVVFYLDIPHITLARLFFGMPGAYALFMLSKRIVQN